MDSDDEDWDHLDGASVSHTPASVTSRLSSKFGAGASHTSAGIASRPLSSRFGAGASHTSAGAASRPLSSKLGASVSHAPAGVASHPLMNKLGAVQAESASEKELEVESVLRSSCENELADAVVNFVAKAALSRSLGGSAPVDRLFQDSAVTILVSELRVDGGALFEAWLRHKMSKALEFRDSLNGLRVRLNPEWDPFTSPALGRRQVCAGSALRVKQAFEYGPVKAPTIQQRAARELCRFEPLPPELIEAVRQLLLLRGGRCNFGEVVNESSVQALKQKHGIPTGRVRSGPTFLTRLLADPEFQVDTVGGHPVLILVSHGSIPAPAAPLKEAEAPAWDKYTPAHILNPRKRKVSPPEDQLIKGRLRTY